MPDPADPAAPKGSSRPRRTRKFVLPEHHHDERVDERTAEHIEAFLEGPTKRSRRRPAAPDRPPRRPLILDTRPDWAAALRHETARHVRYGRPASVVLLRLRGRRPGMAERAAAALAEAIRTEARETDRAVRQDAMSYRLLLPETGNRAARALVERIERAFLELPKGRPDGVEVCIEVATAPRTGTLDEALREAEARLAARTTPGPPATGPGRR